MKRKKSDHPTRKTRIKEDGDWTHKEGWWFKRPDHNNIRGYVGRWSPHIRIKNWQHNMAHECKPGYFRSPSFQLYLGRHKKNIYGGCTNCGAKLPEVLKTLIFFLEFT